MTDETQDFNETRVGAQGAIGVITLNRPKKLNALYSMFEVSMRPWMHGKMMMRLKLFVANSTSVHFVLVVMY